MFWQIFLTLGKKKYGGRENLCLSTLQILLIHEIFIAFLQCTVYKPVNTSTSPIHNHSFQVPMLVAASGSCFIPQHTGQQVLCRMFLCALFLEFLCTPRTRGYWGNPKNRSWMSREHFSPSNLHLCSTCSKFCRPLLPLVLSLPRNTDLLFSWILSESFLHSEDDNESTGYFTLESDIGTFKALNFFFFFFWKPRILACHPQAHTGQDPHSRQAGGSCGCTDSDVGFWVKASLIS